MYSSHRRTGEGLDNESLALKPILGSMLARIYHNPQITEENQMKLQQILQLWVSNNIYDQDTIDAFRNEMIGGSSSNSFPGLPNDISTASTDSAAGMLLVLCVGTNMCLVLLNCQGRLYMFLKLSATGIYKVVACMLICYYFECRNASMAA